MSSNRKKSIWNWNILKKNLFLKGIFLHSWLSHQTDERYRRHIWFSEIANLVLQNYLRTKWSENFIVDVLRTLQWWWCVNLAMRSASYLCLTQCKFCLYKVCFLVSICVLFFLTFMGIFVVSCLQFPHSTLQQIANDWIKGEGR